VAFLDHDHRGPLVQKSDRGLIDADVGLEADEDGGAPAGGLNGFEDRRGAREAEGRLGQRGRDGEAVVRGAVALGFLLGDHDGDLEVRRQGDQPGGAVERLARVGLVSFREVGGVETGLCVDDDHDAVLVRGQGHGKMMRILRTRPSTPSTWTCTPTSQR